MVSLPQWGVSTMILRRSASRILRDQSTAPAVKICGLTDTEQALAIAAMGADAIGVIGVAGTPRYLEDSPRRALFSQLQLNFPSLLRVWVVADPSNAMLDASLQGEGTPTVIQLHGQETPSQCQALRQRHPEITVWKALRLRSQDDLHAVKGYVQSVDGLLLDAWSPDQLGGTGHRLPLDWLAETNLPLPWWLAGGISAEWIPELLDRVTPDGLDASSRLEVRPGWKDLEKVNALLSAVKA